MRVRIETDESRSEDEIIIKCREINDAVRAIERIATSAAGSADISLFKDETEYFIPIAKILFFETCAGGINAHTCDNVFSTKRKLYELESILPGNFLRISKSTILNVNHVYAVTKNLTSSGCVRFYNTHKQVYVSRNYYKVLRTGLDERKLSI